LDERDIRALCRSLRGGDPAAGEAAEAFARAAWSGIAEPGDRVAGALLAAIGARRSLEGLLQRWEPARFSMAIQAEHPDGEHDALKETDLEGAVARWTPRLDSASALAAARQGARIGARLLMPGDELWPRSLDDLGRHAPIALWVRGTDAALGSLSRSVALVGVRAATGYGEHVTMEAAAGLVDR